MGRVGPRLLDDLALEVGRVGLALRGEVIRDEHADEEHDAQADEQCDLGFTGHERVHPFIA